MFVPYASKFEQNRMVLTTWNFEPFDKKQTNKKQTKKRVCYNHFWQRVDAIVEDVSVAKIIV